MSQPEAYTPDYLHAHRELQYLRSAGVSASHRRRKKRKKRMSQSDGQAELTDWVESRGRLLTEAEEIKDRAERRA